MFSQKLKFKEGRFEMFDIKGVILPVYTFSKLLEQEYKSNGDEVFEMLFETGKAHGKMGIERIGRKNKVSKREFQSKMIDSANMMGLGKFEVVNSDMTKEEFKVRLTRSPIVQEFNDSEAMSDVERPVTELSRGMFHSIMGEIWSAEVVSKFSKSKFLGDENTEIKVQLKDDQE